MSLLPRTPALLSALSLVAVTSVLLGGCQDEHKDQAREVAKQAADKTGEGVDRAREVAGEAARKAGEGIADARERYAVDDKVEQTKEKFGEAMDETAEGFAALAEAGKEQSKEVGERLGGARLELEPDSVRCEDAEGDKPRRCHVEPGVIEALGERPMLLAMEGMLKPTRNSERAGLELTRLREDGLPARLGLRQGDVLLVLNGVPLDTFDAIRDLDEALGGQHLATLIYEREGERQTLEIQQQVAEAAKPEADN